MKNITLKTSIILFFSCISSIYGMEIIPAKIPLKPTIKGEICIPISSRAFYPHDAFRKTLKKRGISIRANDPLVEINIQVNEKKWHDSPPDSIIEYEMEHYKEKGRRQQVTSQEMDRIYKKVMPRLFPIRLLLKAEGGFKNNGDHITCTLFGYTTILTCCNNPLSPQEFHQQLHNILQLFKRTPNYLYSKEEDRQKIYDRKILIFTSNHGQIHGPYGYFLDPSSESTCPRTKSSND